MAVAQRELRLIYGMAPCTSPRGWLLWVVLLCVCGSGRVAAADAAATDGGESPPSARQRLIGVWRLAAIDYRGPRSEDIDPFYQPGSTGLIIYDASGWMSVQIGAPHRRAWTSPETRGGPTAADHARLKMQAFDSYYAYYGTWTYDSHTAVVTHHVDSSLVPAEAGSNYRQTVSFEGGRMVFTGRSGAPGAESVRRKIWERLPASVNESRQTMTDSNTR